MTWSDEAVTVRVPATSANLGPGFDALGLALTLHDEVEARVTDAGLSIEISGEGAELADAGENHLVVRAMRAAFGALGGQPPGIALRCVNRIPHGRGLGSSAAAIIAGILAARGLATSSEDLNVLALATELEGHPDNVAACLYGGLTVAWLADGTPRAVRLSPVTGIVPVAVIASEPVRTEVARGLLPPAVPHADATLNAGRSALLIAALTAEPGALLDATEDRLHQHYRASAMPATSDLVGRLRAAGIPAVVSGAGPSVLVLLLSPGGQPPLDRLDSIVRETGIEWLVSPLDVERHGASIQSASPPVPVASGRPSHRTWNRAPRAHGDAAQSSPGR